jgi:galactonate dehydratase
MEESAPSLLSKLLRQLSLYRPLFVEEPCLPENTDAMIKIARSVSVPLATGERLVTRYGIRPLLESGAVAVIQPDLCHAGGIYETRKMAAMAETIYCKIAPHNPLGPVSLAANIQLGACTPNFLIAEHFGMKKEWDIGQGYLKNHSSSRTATLKSHPNPASALQ